VHPQVPKFKVNEFAHISQILVILHLIQFEGEQLTHAVPSALSVVPLGHMHVLFESIKVDVHDAQTSAKSHL
jgi:hypothetical protein